MLILIEVRLDEVDVVVAECTIGIVWVCNFGQAAQGVVGVAGHVAVGGRVGFYLVVPVVGVALDGKDVARVAARVMLDCYFSSESVEVCSGVVALFVLNIDAVLCVPIESVDC